jgi:hypothetical protein
VTPHPVASRRSAATATEDRCPRCGVAREPDQDYCVECGLRLPVVTGGVAVLRRGWIRSLGWYPGDWIWLALATFAVAAAGATIAIDLGRKHGSAAATTYVAPAPKASQVTVPLGRNGRTRWPAGLDGWTVVLLSSPSLHGKAKPVGLAAVAARRGLPQVGVLDSGDFSSLHPGYYVVFSGVYGAAADAQLALQTVRARGYGGAYVQRVAA